jgi:hypothetical protein
MASPFSKETQWHKWFINNRLILAYSVLIGMLSLLMAWGQVSSYFRYGTLTNSWQWLFLPIAFLGGLWFISTRKTSYLYDAFLEEVEKRQQTQNSVVLSDAKRKEMHLHERLSNNYLWKIVSILLCGSWAFTYLHQEFKRFNLKEPVRLSVQLKQSFQYKQNQLVKLSKEYCDMYASLRYHQAKVIALKRTKQHTQSSIQEQWYNYVHGQNARNVLGQAQASPNSIRENEPVYNMVKGQTEIYLFLQNKEAQASSALLSQDEQLLKSFYDVQNRYDQYLHTAQKSVYRDQNRLNGLDQEIKHEQKIVERLMIAIADNERLQKKMLAKLQQESNLWLKRVEYEKQIEARRKEAQN